MPLPSVYFLFPNSMLLSSLHEDVLRFCEWIAPTHAEQQMRADILKRYSAIVSRLWPSASAAAFGSTRTELYLPMSDMDLVVLGHTAGNDPLAKLASALRASGIAKSVNLIGSARVPIVKLVDRQTDTCVDICINKQTGVSSSLLLHQFLESMPALRPLVLILKFFLHQHGLGEVYTGGIGSYCVTLLTISYLQVRGDRVRISKVGFKWDHSCKQEKPISTNWI